MGKWSQKQYDDVLVTKVMRLFEHAMGYVGPAVPDKRFKTFVKQLDPENTFTQQMFRKLVMHGVYGPGVYGPERPIEVHPASTSLGPSGLPLPVPDEHMRIIYGGPPAPQTALEGILAGRSRARESWREREPREMRASDTRETGVSQLTLLRQMRGRQMREPRESRDDWETVRLLDRSPTPIPVRNASSSGANDYRPYATTPPVPSRTAAISFHGTDQTIGPMLSDSSPPPPSLSHARARNRRQHQSGIYPPDEEQSIPTHMWDMGSPRSSPNASSRAWLEEYDAATVISAPPDNGVAHRLATFQTLTGRHPRVARPITHRVRRSQAPIVIQPLSDSDASEAPDDFDNLLDQPPSSVIRPARRRRQEEDEDDMERERPTARRRLRRSSSLSDGETSWQDNHPWLAGLPMSRSAARQGQDGRDTRRDGVVLDLAAFRAAAEPNLDSEHAPSQITDFGFRLSAGAGGEQVQQSLMDRPIVVSDEDEAPETSHIDRSQSP
ncbi:hypothetical protein IAU59_001017 [Kwoniella sp. CBS 9459]